MTDVYNNQRRFVYGERVVTVNPDGQPVVMAIQGEPVEARLTAVEARQAEIERKLDNLIEYVRTLMTNGQKLRCTRPDR